MTPIYGTYDYRLVLLSLLIAMLTSFTALDLAGRIAANHGITRRIWLLGGSISMGSGIWCMHYTGMLAYRLSIPVLYHLPTVAISLVAAILASGIALYVVSRSRLKLGHILAGSFLMGGGVATMHYTGMAAMRMKAMHHYSPAVWMLSIVLAVAISFGGLRIIFYARDNQREWKRKLAAALSLGLAISAMHYTGMAAIRFVPMASSPDLSHSLDISTLANSAILMVAILILGFTLATSLVERRLSSQQVILNNERKMLRALIDNVPDFMYVKDKDGRFLIANPPTAAAVGMPEPRNLIGKTDFDFFSPELAEAYFGEEQSVMTTGRGIFDHEEISRDIEGAEIPVLVTKVALRDSDGNITGIAAIGRDISKRKAREEALREAEKKYRTIFDEAMVGMFQLDANGCLLNVNSSMAHFMKYDSPAEMLSTMKVPLWIHAVSTERQMKLMDAIRETGYVRSFEMEIYQKDLGKIWISSSVRAVIHDEELAGFEGMFEDITERKSLREKLLHAQKLESVGQLAAGIAHEINTPTQYIGDNVRFLKDTFQDLTTILAIYRDLLRAANAGEMTPALIATAVTAEKKLDMEYLLQEIPSAIDQTLEGICAVATLVGAMKEFSHPGTVDRIPLDLNHAIESTITVARNEWKYVADVETTFDRLLPLISCQPGEFNQVILNLIVNAAHAIADRDQEGGKKGIIRVETRDSSLGVEVRISDTGSGIPASARDRIFDPFFTTKEIGRGTGQGLSIARSVIVDKHGGTIDFETIEGEGTTFIIRLPHDEVPGMDKLVIQ